MLMLAATILAAMALVSMVAFLLEALATRRDRGYVRVERHASHPVGDRRHEGWITRSGHDRRVARLEWNRTDRRSRTDRRAAA